MWFGWPETPPESNVMITSNEAVGAELTGVLEMFGAKYRVKMLPMSFASHVAVIESGNFSSSITTTCSAEVMPSSKALSFNSPLRI